MYILPYRTTRDRRGFGYGLRGFGYGLRVMMISASRESTKRPRPADPSEG